MFARLQEDFKAGAVEAFPSVRMLPSRRSPKPPRQTESSGHSHPALELLRSLLQDRRLPHVRSAKVEHAFQAYRKAERNQPAFSR